MPDDKACHEDNGWHIRQVVSFRPKRPFLEGHDRNEETEDEKRRKTAEQSEKSSRMVLLGVERRRRELFSFARSRPFKSVSGMAQEGHRISQSLTLR